MTDSLHRVASGATSHVLEDVSAVKQDEIHRDRMRERILVALGALVKRIERVPTPNEVNQCLRFSILTIEHYFGSLGEALAALPLPMPSSPPLFPLAKIAKWLSPPEWEGLAGLFAEAKTLLHEIRDARSTPTETFVREIARGFRERYGGSAGKVPGTDVNTVRRWLEGRALQAKSTECWELRLARIIRLFETPGRREAFVSKAATLARVWNFPPFEPWMVDATRRELLIYRLRELAKELGHAPTVSEMKQKRGAPSISVCRAEFGTWSKALEIASLTPIAHSKAVIEAEKRWVRVNDLTKRIHAMEGCSRGPSALETFVTGLESISPNMAAVFRNLVQGTDGIKKSQEVMAAELGLRQDLVSYWERKFRTLSVELGWEFAKETNIALAQNRSRKVDHLATLALKEGWTTDRFKAELERVSPERAMVFENMMDAEGGQQKSQVAMAKACNCSSPTIAKWKERFEALCLEAGWHKAKQTGNLEYAADSSRQEKDLPSGGVVQAPDGDGMDRVEQEQAEMARHPEGFGDMSGTFFPKLMTTPSAPAFSAKDLAVPGGELKEPDHRSATLIFPGMSPELAVLARKLPPTDTRPHSAAPSPQPPPTTPQTGQEGEGVVEDPRFTILRNDIEIAARIASVANTAWSVLHGGLDLAGKMGTFMGEGCTAILSLATISLRHHVDRYKAGNEL